MLMKTIVFNTHGSVIDKGGESVALRIGYLLGDYAVSAGTSGFDICFNTWFNPPKVEQKVAWIEKFYEQRGEESSLKVEEVKRTMKALRKIKHLDKQGIVIQKKFEKAVDTLFQIAKGEALEEKMKTGLPQLEPIYDGKVLGGYSTNLGAPEQPEKHDYAASQLLSLDLPDPEEGLSLFFLTHEFLLVQDNNKRKWYSARDSAASSAQNMYFEKFFSFPALNILNAVELKTVRQQLEPLAIHFRKAVDRWMELCYQPASPKETLEHFRQQVQIHAAPINMLIKQNEVLEHYKRLVNQQAVINVYMGEVPVKLIWDFYREGKAIADETWDKLMQLYETKNLSGQRWPVMVIEIPEAKIVMQENNTPQHDVKPVKKSISVD